MKQQPTLMTPEQIDTARQLLEDGCSYRETARTLSTTRYRVMATLPGYGWTYRESGHFTASMRWCRSHG